MTNAKTQNGLNPELRQLSKMIGTWKATDSEGREGKTSFEWMEGKHFLIHNVDLGDTKGIEFIGYDEPSDSVKSFYFDTEGNLRQYTYHVRDNMIKITIDMPEVQGEFTGDLNNDGTKLIGNWDLMENGQRKGSKATLTRIV